MGLAGLKMLLSSSCRLYFVSLRVWLIVGEIVVEKLKVRVRLNVCVHAVAGYS